MVLPVIHLIFGAGGWERKGWFPFLLPFSHGSICALLRCQFCITQRQIQAHNWAYSTEPQCDVIWVSRRKKTTKKHHNCIIPAFSELQTDSAVTKQLQMGLFLHFSYHKCILTFRPEVTTQKSNSAGTKEAALSISSLQLIGFTCTAESPAGPLTCGAPGSLSAQQRWIHWFDRGAGQRKAARGWGAPKRKQNLLCHGREKHKTHHRHLERTRQGATSPWCNLSHFIISAHIPLPITVMTN